MDIKTIFFFLRKKNLNHRFLTLFSLLIVSYFILSSSISLKGQRSLINFNSKIDLIINGKGNQSFLSDEFIFEPNEVIVNGISITEKSCKKYGEFDEEINYITLIFDSNIESCENMFKGLDNIIEINLEEFDSSKVVNMSSMFNQCINLKKINFGNINTSLVQDMSYLFYNCYKLISIDLSSFDTSSVTNMGMMFNNCSSLKSLDVS